MAEKLLQALFFVVFLGVFVYQHDVALRIVASSGDGPVTGTVRSIYEETRSGPVNATITDLTFDCERPYRLYQPSRREKGPPPYPHWGVAAAGQDKSIFVLVTAANARDLPCVDGEVDRTGTAMRVRPKVREIFGPDLPRETMEFVVGKVDPSFWTMVLFLTAALVYAAFSWVPSFRKERNGGDAGIAPPPLVPAAKSPAPVVRHPQGHLYKEDRKTLHEWLGLTDPIPSRFEDPAITFKLERALGMLDWSTMRFADDYAAWHYRGAVQEALGQYRQALESYRIALLRNPRSDEASNLLAQETEARARYSRTHVPAAGQRA